MKPVAELRFRRVATFALGASTAISGVADWGATMAQAPYLPVWWWYLTIAINVGGTLGFLVLPWVGTRLLRPVTLVYAIGNLAMLAVFVPAVGLHGLPDDLGAPWQIRLLSSFGIAAALSLPTRWVWAYVVALAAGAFGARWLGSESGDPAVALNDVLVGLSVTVPFVLVALAVVRTGRQLDMAGSAAIEAARRDAAGAAAAIERRRVELLAHDEILSTLRATSLGFRTATTTPATLARASIARLDEVEAPGDATDVDVVTRLRALTTLLAPDARVDAVGDAPVPAHVADELLAAAGEALRNSVAYAPGAQRTVAVRVAPGSVQVTITDDGPGFRRGTVPAGRLGVARSIIERMRSVPGGTAQVRSDPGHGTTVDLGWIA